MPKCGMVGSETREPFLANDRKEEVSFYPVGGLVPSIHFIAQLECTRPVLGDTENI